MIKTHQVSENLAAESKRSVLAECLPFLAGCSD